MIRIAKSTHGPKSFITKGTQARDLVCAEYDTCAHDYDTGTKILTKSKATIYGSRTVKRILMKAQHNKCCYCEQVFGVPRDLAVEHFRPKSGARQLRKGRAAFHPGYYWMVYDWDNLFLSCHECNSTYKQTIFPLSNPSRRARSHHDDISREHPLLIHPGLQDPRDHIRFYNEIPVPQTKFGRISIREIGLRRVALREARLKELKRLRYWRSVILKSQKHPRSKALRDLADEARDFLRDATRPESLFSSMALDFLDGFPI